MAKKAAVMIYPQFSMQEISCLTDALKVYFDIEIDVFAQTQKSPLPKGRGFER